VTAASPVELAAAPRERRALRLGGARSLDPRDNALNLIRLVLAAAVLFAHAFYITGAGVGPHVDGENVGGWAVFGFFALSGYLITGSRLNNPLGTYLVHRIARIMPAFWVNLVVTAFAFAPIGYWVQHRTLSGFLTTGTTPLQYVFANGLLQISAYDVAGTPAGVPYPGAWNGSLWSLYYEFLCYLVIGGLAVLAWVRRSPWGVGVAFGVSVVAHVGMTRAGFLLGGDADAVLLTKLLPLFLGGALIQVLGDRVRLHWAAALGSAGVVAAAVAVLDGWGAQLTAPLTAYVLLWLGAVIRSPRLVQRHDVSYGVYIYAFPVQQLLALAGLQDHAPIAVSMLAAAVLTVPLAVASWLLVERPVMRAARRTTQTAPA
jgi:peptidoglycan/LPS O-acetylase OafA/YrhL